MRTTLVAAMGLARKGEWKELEWLIDRHPELATATDDAGETLLTWCSGFGGSASALRKLIANHADPNHRTFNGSNALAAAIVGGSRYGLTTLPELRTLLECGADPNSVADAGMPALHWAIAQYRPEHAKVLLEYGVDIERLTEDSPPESVDDILARIKSEEALKLITEFRNQRNAGLAGI